MYRSTVYQDHWCPTCAGQSNNSLEKAQKVAAERGGRCLSDLYISTRTQMVWECSEGHQWSAVFGNIGDGKWCPVCNAGRYDHLERMQEVAGSRSGKCLTKEYTGIKDQALWECARGHTWEATADNVLNRGTWCPCCRYRSEEEVRTLLERLTGHKFPKKRGVLESARLELDGYCAPLRLAFEYQGVQHYEYVPHFHRGGGVDLERQQARDRQKEEECAEAWIALVVVPYDCLELEAFLRRELRLLGVLAE